MQRPLICCCLDEKGEDPNDVEVATELSLEAEVFLSFKFPTTK